MNFGSNGTAKELYEKRYARSDATLDGIPGTPLLYVSSHPSRELRKDLQVAGIDFSTSEGKVDFHSLRNTFVTLSFESGATVIEAQALARHSTPELTTNIYARTRDDRLSDLVDKIGGAVISDDLHAHSMHWPMTG